MNKDRTGTTKITQWDRQHYAEIGRRGGSARVKKGFAMNTSLASTAGTLGGRISRRKHKLSDEERRRIREIYAIRTGVMPKRLDEGAITVFDRKRGLVHEQVA